MNGNTETYTGPLPNTLNEVIDLMQKYSNDEIKLSDEVIDRCLSIQEQEITKNTQPNVDEFIRFLDRLSDAGITEPALIPLVRHDKAPDTTRGGKILNDNKTVINNQYRLNREAAIEWMKAGNNVGMYGTPDGLLFLDADIDKSRMVYPEERYRELVTSQNTLTCMTRSGGGLLVFRSNGEKGNPHHYYENVDAGEIRRDWQYVVCPGSFIPKTKMFKANDTKGHTPSATGYYTITLDAPIQNFDTTLLPAWFRIGKVKEAPPMIKNNLPIPAQIPTHTEFENKFGRTLQQIRWENFVLNAALTGIEPDEDRSAMDFRVCMILLRNHFEITTIAPILSKFRNYEKTQRENYIQNTVMKAYTKHREWIKKNGYIIQTNNKYLAEKSDTAFEALLEHNVYPTLFYRGSSLVHITRNDKGVPLTGIVGEKDLCNRLTRSARFIERRVKKAKKEGEQDETVITRVDPPLRVIQDIMVHPKIPEYFPGLYSISCVPIIHTDGSIFAVPGYDAESKSYYAPISIDAIKVPDAPTDEDIKNARQLLEEIIENFPFYDDEDNPFSAGASKANTLGMFVTSVARPLITGKIPLYLIDKPQRGTGASLLCEVLSAIALGAKAEFAKPPETEEEWKKTITTLVVSGSSLNIFDNTDGKLYSSSLSSVITAPVWKDRVLGKNTELHSFPTDGIMWVVNGNNLILGGDISRRSVWVRMDAKTPRPWERKAEFRHGQGGEFIEWVLTNRGEILSAILTLIRAWIVREEPAPENPHIIGGFESWSRIVGGVLNLAGVQGFLGNLDELYDSSDIDTQEWSNFAAVWHEKLNVYPYTGREIFDLMKTLSTESQDEYMKGSALLDALPSELSSAYSSKGDSFTRVFGKALKKKKDVRYLVDKKIYRFTTDKSVNRSICWKVVAEPI